MNSRIRWAAVTLIALCLGTATLSATPAAQSSSPPTVRVGGDIKPPVKVKSPPPSYPALAKQARVEGVVIVEATVGVDGKVKDVKVIRSIKALDDAAVTAVRTWEFKPTLVNGQAVQVITTIPVNFSLE